MANEAVLKYLLDTNRPYSCTDVTANLRGAYNKAAVQRALDALSESGQIRCKVYGKQKVYTALQNDDQSGNEDLGDLERGLQTITNQLTEETSALKSAETALRALISAPTTSKAREQLHLTTDKVNSLRIKLDGLKSSKDVVSAEDKAKILDKHETLYKEYRKRKSICTQMMDAILEGYPKSKKNLIEELCMETDEMVNFTPTTR